MSHYTRIFQVIQVLLNLNKEIFRLNPSAMLEDTLCKECIDADKLISKQL